MPRMTSFTNQTSEHTDQSLPSGLTQRVRPESSTAPSDEITPTYNGSSHSSSKPPRTFKSFRLRGEYEKPWVDDKRLKKIRVGNWIVLGFIAVGICASAYIMYTGVKAATLPPQCLVLEDTFKTIDSKTWGYEIQTGGYGNGEFDWTTNDPKNSFVDAQGLHIVPTLTTESTSITEDQLVNGYTLNITKASGDGSCTSTDYLSCGVKSNATLGTIIPPVRSARMTTQGKKSIKYGRVEVVAKMARGDWLWPAIWMMPEDSVYGAWPASGEIDIAETRGNNYTYAEGNNFVASTLHWGPSYKHDAYKLTSGSTYLRRTDFTEGFHTFGMEWTENYIFMYLDNRLKQIRYTPFKKSAMLWQRGGFAGLTTSNGTLVDNPWKSGGYNAPFDQKFYLILNVAVGAQNGWFFDGLGGKPWVDGSAFAARDFYRAKNQWLPSWGQGTDRGMTVKSVKMWQAGNC